MTMIRIVKVEGERRMVLIAVQWRNFSELHSTEN